MAAPAFPLLLALACRGSTEQKRGGSSGPDSPSPSQDSAPTPAESISHVVIVVTDDQRADTLWAMPTVSDRLLGEGMSFSAAYVTSPLCCPERASFLSGGFRPVHTGVLSNEMPNGSSALFPDEDTLATALQEQGFATGLFGKYLNTAEGADAVYIPPGWTQYSALADVTTWTDFTLIEGSSGVASSTGELVHHSEYITDVLGAEAVEFIGEHAHEPFFLYLATTAPHLPAEPADEDAALYADRVWRGGAWNEADVSDKPIHVSSRPLLEPTEIAALDEQAREQLRTLASVDRMVGRLLDSLEEQGELDHTLFVFTSDNGYLWGEHRLTDKGLPYEESIRVPFVIRGPGISRRSSFSPVAVNLDLPATLLDLFDLDRPTDGLSFLPLLRGLEASRRPPFIIECYAEGNPLWSGLVKEQWRYAIYATGEEELYDLQSDPSELSNLAAFPPEEAGIEAIRDQVVAERGLAILSPALPSGTVGEPYDSTVETWGGTPPLIFTEEAGRLPPGLTMDVDGRISGTPTSEGSYWVAARVTDSSASPWTGAPQTHSVSFLLDVGGSPAALVGPPEVVGLGPDTARIRLRSRRPAHGLLRWSASPSHDLFPRQHSFEIDGSLELPLDRLAPGGTWYWELHVDGAFQARGQLRTPPR